jgi:hypothetical protein
MFEPGSSKRHVKEIASSFAPKFWTVSHVCSEGQVVSPPEPGMTLPAGRRRANAVQGRVRPLILKENAVRLLGL